MKTIYQDRAELYKEMMVSISNNESFSCIYKHYTYMYVDHALYRIDSHKRQVNLYHLGYLKSLIMPVDNILPIESLLSGIKVPEHYSVIKPKPQPVSKSREKKVYNHPDRDWFYPQGGFSAREEMYCIDNNWFRSRSELAQYCKSTTQSVSRYLEGKKTSYDYPPIDVYSYNGELLRSLSAYKGIEHREKGKRCYVNGQLYNTIREACTILDIDQTSAYRAIKGLSIRGARPTNPEHLYTTRDGRSFILYWEDEYVERDS